MRSIPSRTHRFLTSASSATSAEKFPASTRIHGVREKIFSNCSRYVARRAKPPRGLRLQPQGST